MNNLKIYYYRYNYIILDYTFLYNYIYGERILKQNKLQKTM